MKNLNEILGISPLIREFNKNAQNLKSQKIIGTTIGEKSLILSQLTGGIYICDDLVSFNDANELLTSLGFKVGTISTIEENLFLSSIKDNEVNFNLIKNIYDFLLGKVDFLICSPSVLMQKLPTREQF